MDILMSVSDYLFKLPDGTHLSYAFPYDLKKCGKQFKWFRSFKDYRVVSVTPQKKSHAPRLGLWTSRGTTKFVCADFDKLPVGYSRWSQFEEAVREKFPNDYVFKSASGKVKVLFLVELYRGYIDCKRAKYALKQILPSAWYKVVDTSYFGMSITYLNPMIVAGLCRYLETKPVARKINFSPLFRKTVDGHFFKAHEGPLPKYLQKFVKGNRGKEMFCRILFRQRGMAMKKGFDIPTTKFANELGVSQKTVHRWREELISLGLIKCIDKKYKINKKAQTFKAIGLFKKTVIRIFTSVKTKVSGKYKKHISLPTQIEDGNWHSTIWDLSKYFFRDRQEEFLAWVASVPDSDTKRRLRKARYALISRCKYNGLPHNHLVI
jgi:DNA-binding Lrp family transcriptional regulator